MSLELRCMCRGGVGATSLSKSYITDFNRVIFWRCCGLQKTNFTREYASGGQIGIRIIDRSFPKNDFFRKCTARYAELADWEN